LSVSTRSASHRAFVHAGGCCHLESSQGSSNRERLGPLRR
jgi:hypothetical protein